MITPELRHVIQRFRLSTTIHLANGRKHEKPHQSDFGLALAPGRDMLKISIKNSRSRRLLFLEGKIIAPWTDELTRVAFQDHANHMAGRELVIDLEGVTDIGADGEETLYCLLSHGAKFRGGGVFIKQVMERLAQRMR